MAVIQSGPQEASPIAGKMKNCAVWAAYETPGSSPSANMCHGGTFEGDVYGPCPVRAECKMATIEGVTEQPTRSSTNGIRRALPVMNNVQVANNNSGARPASVPQIRVPQFQQPNLGTSLPAQVAQRRMLQQPIETTFPQPIIPPEEYPAAMRTPYASTTPVYGGGTSPTFLPRDGENVFERLTKNAMQGAISAVGWHVFDFTRSVDLFGG